MGFLSTLLPGVRELRAPLIAGSLWAACLYIGLANKLSAILDIQRLVELAKPGWCGRFVLAPSVISRRCIPSWPDVAVNLQMACSWLDQRCP